MLRTRCRATRRCLVPGLLLAGSLALQPGPASADTVSLHFAGTTTSAAFPSRGAPVSAIISLDEDAPDLEPSPEVGVYAPVAVRILAGGHTLDVTGSYEFVVDLGFESIFVRVAGPPGDLLVDGAPVPGLLHFDCRLSTPLVSDAVPSPEATPTLEGSPSLCFLNAAAAPLSFNARPATNVDWAQSTLAVLRVEREPANTGVAIWNVGRWGHMVWGSVGLPALGAGGIALLAGVLIATSRLRPSRHASRPLLTRESRR